MTVHAATIFLSSFLLFQVQPLIARSILPWFGGSAAVWTTCMLFFQGLLLVGYLYAWISATRLSPKHQAILHVTLLALALLFLPIIPSHAWKPGGSDAPLLGIIGVLAATVGVPYILLSATSPLIQAWYARTHEGKIPYRLFALSNVGSLLGLVTYPPLVEPYLPLRAQAVVWSAAFVLFAIFCTCTAWKSRRGEAAGSAPEEEGYEPVPRIILWGALPAASSALLLAVTTHMTQNVAAIPFLWIIPLILYLLSFIICFEKESWYRRSVWFPLGAAAIGAMTWSLLHGDGTPKLGILLPLFSLGLFACCMLCHGELVRLKPHPGRLTSYYLASSLGGAVGGLFVGVLSPVMFSRYHELPFSIVAVSLLAAAALFLNPPPLQPAMRRAAAGSVLAAALVPAIYFPAVGKEAANRRSQRNFYGVLCLVDENDGVRTRTLLHGIIQHGKQYLSGPLRCAPTTYYGHPSGVGLAMAGVQRRGRVDAAVVGLGAGTLAAYGREGDRFTFYEINPLVLKMAKEDFTYLSDTKGSIRVVMGDARLTLERETETFDLLAVDAFSGDSIPVHLLTKEALELYFRRLKRDGILAVHISNKYLDLEPVLADGLKALGKHAVVVESEEDEENGVYSATWVLAAAEPLELKGEGVRGIACTPGSSCWTDDYSNLFKILK